VLIVLEGGLISEIFADGPVRIRAIDLDTEGADPEDYFTTESQVTSGFVSGFTTRPLDQMPASYQELLFQAEMAAVDG
jgi:hypothetical protein